MAQYEILISATARFVRNCEIPHTEEDTQVSLLAKSNMTAKETGLISVREGFQIVSVTPEPGLGGIDLRTALADIDVEAVVRAEGVVVVEAVSEEEARNLFYDNFVSDATFEVFERANAGEWAFDESEGFNALSFDEVQPQDSLAPSF